MANSIASKILAAVNDLVTLEVRTIVGDVTIVNQKIEPVQGSSDSIQTQINLIDGDITTSMSEKFLTDPNYTPLREYQAQREKQGHEIIQANIAALKSLIDLFNKADSEVKGDDVANATTTTTTTPAGS